jgi:uncharacterized protein (TIGR02246 family)
MADETSRFLGRIYQRWGRTMSQSEKNRARATQPEDLNRFFLERANAGDVEGIVALYEPDAVLVGPGRRVITGTEALRQAYTQLFAGKPTFVGETQAAIHNGDLALTSTRFTISGPGSDGELRSIRTATTEVARRQPDGIWLWVIDQPNVLA